MRRLAALFCALCAGLATGAVGASPAEAGGLSGGWRPVGHVLLVDVPASAGVVLDVNPFRSGTQTLAVVLHNDDEGLLRFSTLFGRVLGEGPDGGFTPGDSVGAGWRGFAWGETAGAARIWTPAFDAGGTLLSVDPLLSCGEVVDASTPLAGPFEVTIPPGARPGRQTVPSPARALVFGDPAGGVRIVTDGGVTLGRRGGASVAQGGFSFAGAVFAYGTTGGQPVMWTPALVSRSTRLVSTRFVACTEPPAEGTITVTKELVPATDTGRFDLEIDGTAHAAGVGDGGTTGPVTVPAGEHTVSEPAAAGYETSFECVEDTNAASPLTAAGASLAGIPVEAGDEWACTITNTLDAADLPQLGVSPSSAPPGSPLALELPAGVAAGGSLTLLVGGEPAPVVQDAAGALAASVPLFLDPATGWPAPPDGPLDLILLSDGVAVAGANGALTVSELAPAPGSAEGAQSALSGIVASFERIGQALGTEPGAQEQWLTALSGALDELVNGSDPRSLAGVLASADAQTRELLDAWFASSGVLDALQQYEQGVAAAADALAAGNRSLAAAQLARMPQGLAPGITDFPSDVELAEQMQFYETAKAFGQQVIAETNQEWSTYVGIAAGAIALVRAIPAVPIISAILAVADFAFNKLYLALLPANIDRFELTLASTLLDRGETTDAFLHLDAVNEPPPIGIQDFVGITLNVLGLGNAPAIQGLRDALVQTAAYMLGLIQQGLSAYAGEHPELNLDTGVASVPAMRWQTTVVDPSLVDRISRTSAVIAGLPDQVNWKASDTECGQGTILARTFANTWGDDLRDSNTVLVDVECVEVSVSVSPTSVTLGPLGEQQFTAAVSGVADQSVTWGASGGAITGNGLYTAPAETGTYTITATSWVDPSKTATATVTVTEGVIVRFLDANATASTGGGDQSSTISFGDVESAPNGLPSHEGTAQGGAGGEIPPELGEGDGSASGSAEYGYAFVANPDGSGQFNGNASATVDTAASGAASFSATASGSINVWFSITGGSLQLEISGSSMPRATARLLGGGGGVIFSAGEGFPSTMVLGPGVYQAAVSASSVGCSGSGCGPNLTASDSQSASLSFTLSPVDPNGGGGGGDGGGDGGGVTL